MFLFDVAVVSFNSLWYLFYFDVGLDLAVN